MKNASHRLGIIIALAAALSLSACGGGTGFHQTWVEPTAVNVQLKRIGVVGVAADPAVRTQFEEVFADALQKRGNDARAGHTFIPEEMRGHIDQIRQKLVDEKFDGVLVTRLAPDSSAVAGKSEMTGELTPPAAPVDDNVRLRTTLYRVSDAVILWDAITSTDRGRSLKQSAAAFSQTVSLELGSQGIIR